MALTWMEQIHHFFKQITSGPPTPVKEVSEVPLRTAYGFVEITMPYITKSQESVVEVNKEVEPPLVGFQKIRVEFNPATDMLITSYNKCSELSLEDLTWLNSLGNKVYYFDNDLLVNTAIVRSY